MENKHSRDDLIQRQKLPLEAKIKMSQQRIQEWYDYWDGKVYVSISGGKDSQVLAHIVKQLYPNVPLVFVNTGLEYDSVRKKGLELANETLQPKMDFVSVIKKYGYPIVSKEVSQAIYECQTARRKGKEMPKYRTDKLLGLAINPDGAKSQYNMERWGFLLDAPFRISHMCCNVMKKNPSKQYEHRTGNAPYLGTMAVESKLRKSKWIKLGCNAFEEKRPTSQPLSFWTEQDILHYIRQNQLEIADIYKEIICIDETNDILELTGAPRTGCVYCMFGIKYDSEKFERLKYEEPNKYDYIMRGGQFDSENMWIPYQGLGYKFVIDWLNENGNLNIKY